MVHTNMRQDDSPPMNARAQRRRAIVDAAESLFLNNDLVGITMKDISVAAGITKATLYKYFASIDEIAFEVQIKVYVSLFEFPDSLPPLSEQDISNGRDQLRAFLRAQLLFAQKYPEHVRYLGFFDHY